MLLERLALKFVIIALLVGVLITPTVARSDFVVDLTATNLMPIASVYTWQRSVTGDWQSPLNWSPARTAPASSDILFFNIGGTMTVTNVPNETIGQLIVSGNTIVNLQSTSAVSLTIVGDIGVDFQVATGSELNFGGTNSIIANLLSGASANIKGSITFSSTGSAAHRLTAIDVGAIRFIDGAVFTASSGFTGNAFGTSNLNSVIFASGSKYVCLGGGDPFGSAQPNSVVIFETGSLFSLLGNAQTSFSGRTYANFELNFPSGQVTAVGSNRLIMDDLTVLAGTLNLNMTGNPGHSIKGNITFAQGVNSNLCPMTAGTININGTTSQTISGRGWGACGSSTLVIDNPNGVIVDYGLVSWNLVLLNGVVTVTDPLGSVSSGGNVTRINGFIDGYQLRVFSGARIYVFDVGTKNNYSPMSLNVTSGVDNAAYIKAIQGPQPNIINPSRSLYRYWEIYPSGNISADITFHYLDPPDVPGSANESTFVILKYDGTFSQPDFGVIDTQANIFRINGVSLSISDWTLAEPVAVFTPTATASTTPTVTNTPTNTPTATPTPTATSTPLGRTAFDYDGDHKSDISVFRPLSGAWYLQESQNGLYGTLFGFGSDKIAPADYDGDGKADIAVYRPSTGIWYVFNSSNGTVSYSVFGLAEDLPTPADYDGDGKADISVYRPSTGTWYRQNSSNGSFFGVQFGASEDKPTVGDFDGDGKADIAVFRPSTGAWYRINSGNGSIYGELFGFGTDKITPADYDGDGKTDFAVYRPSTGIWYLKYSSNSSYDYKVFGLAADIPAPGDFDGDGKADICVFRPSDGTWYRQNSSNGAFFAFQFGANGDKPTMTAFRY